jgi:hypothetical protein
VQLVLTHRIGPRCCACVRACLCACALSGVCARVPLCVVCACCICAGRARSWRVGMDRVCARVCRTLHEVCCMLRAEGCLRSHVARRFFACHSRHGSTAAGVDGCASSASCQLNLEAVRAHTHTATHAHTRTQPRTPARTQPCTQARRHGRTHACAHTHAATHAGTHAHTLRTHARSRSLAAHQRNRRSAGCRWRSCRVCALHGA